MPAYSFVVIIAGALSAHAQSIIAIEVTPSSITLYPGDTQQFTATATTAAGTNTDVTNLVTWSSSDPAVVAISSTGFATAGFPGTSTITATLAALSDTASVIVDNLPPEPSTVAPPIDQRKPTSMFETTSFLYTGTNPIQRNVSAGTIESHRVSILQGEVISRSGSPLSGVLITIVNHPEFGFTHSRLSGKFDLAVNGGGTLTVRYEKQGYITVERHVVTRWLQFAEAPQVVMIPYDTAVTTIPMNATEMKVARGSDVTDADGTRKATLLFQSGTTATMTLADGTAQSLAQLDVRATEFTVGDSGPLAMPANLPGQSGYTYCVELSADEAVAVNAERIDFSKPVIFYLENFIGFASGSIVPTGYYDRKRGLWIASDNGVVLKILSESGGIAEVDTNADGIADDPSTLAAKGITTEEREQLAALYEPDQTLWRVPIPHFTPWDHNWPYGPPSDADDPDNAKGKSGAEWISGSKYKCGSIIDCENQALGETFAIAGTPFSLHYDSQRIKGRAASFRLDLPLSGASFPASLKRVVFEVEVAGSRAKNSFTPSTNLSQTFRWNGLDAYGRRVQGTRMANVRIGYVYDGVYQTPAQQEKSFGQFSGVPIGINRANREIVLWQEYEIPVGMLDAEHLALGGFSFDVLHRYDPYSRTLYLGNGEERSAEASGNIIQTIAGNGTAGFLGDGGPAIDARLDAPSGLAVDPRGNLFIADRGNGRIRKIAPDGMITTIAGNGTGGDGGPAVDADLCGTWGVSVGRDGKTLYLTEICTHKVRRIDPNGIIGTVAGNGTQGYNGDGGPATSHSLYQPTGVTEAPDGSIYIADQLNHRVRRVSLDGKISTVAGTGTAGNAGDGGPATLAQLWYPYRVDAADDGSIYITSVNPGSIRKIGVDGIITTVAGGDDTYALPSEGVPAIEASLGYPTDVAVARDGTFFIADDGENKLYRVRADGVQVRVAGEGQTADTGDYGPSAAAGIKSLTATAIGQDGSLYIAGETGHRVRKITFAFPGLAAGEMFVPSSDGKEIYIFDGSLRHVRTVDSIFQTVLLRFGYDSGGRLISITDADDNVTTIQRTGDEPTAIIAPFGQQTTLDMDANGYLSLIQNPASESHQFTYFANGLMDTYTDPRSGDHVFTFDSEGRLTRDEDPAGGATILTRVELEDGHRVDVSSIMGRTNRLDTTTLDSEAESRIDIAPSGEQTLTTIGKNEQRKITAPDGTITTITPGGDPRFGMQSPIVAKLEIKTPAGLTSTTTGSRTVTLSDPTNPFSVTTTTDNVVVNGRTYKATFDTEFRYLDLITPMNRFTTTVFDEKNRPIEYAAPGSASTFYEYDIRGLLKNATQDTRQYTFTYYPNGYLETVVDPLSRTQRFEYNSAGRMTKQILPDLREINFTYDAHGNITSVTPPGRPSHAFGYTAVDLEESYTPPSLPSGATNTQYAYNLDRQLELVTRPDGSTIDFVYETTGGRLSSVTHPGGTLTYGYDATKGTLTSLAAPDATLGYTYDGFLLKQIAWSAGVSGRTDFTYDSNFRVATERVNGTTSLSFGYNNDSLLTSAGSLTITRNATTGFITSTVLSNANDAWSYNTTFGELSGYTAKYNTTAVYSYTLTRDAGGRIDTRSETVSGATNTFVYRYDTAGRLDEVKKNGSVISSYTYDSNSNRVTKTTSGGSESGVYDDQDRMTSYNGATYSYTANGDLATKTVGTDVTTYSYDALGNLKRVVLPNGTTIDYLVDGQNRRVGKKVNGALTQAFLYRDQLRPIAELNGSGAVVARFVYGTKSNVPDYIRKGTTNYRVFSDHLGSPRLIVNAGTGVIAQQIEYDEFGNVISDSSPGFQPFGFAGGLYDRDTKLVRFGARDYDSQAGRWTAKDPIGFSAGDSNQYGYTFSDPINLRDFSGLEIYITRHRVGKAGPNHTAIQINPKNPNWFKDPRFSRGYATLSASRRGGKLVSQVNRPEDSAENNSIVGCVAIPRGMTEDDFIQRLFDLDANYRDGLDYDLFPGALSGSGYNSNSYVEGLINAAQGMSPGWGQSFGSFDVVPASAFNP